MIWNIEYRTFCILYWLYHWKYSEAHWIFSVIKWIFSLIKSEQDTKCPIFVLLVNLYRNILELKMSYFTSFNTRSTSFEGMTSRRRSVLWMTSNLFHSWKHAHEDKARYVCLKTWRYPSQQANNFFICACKGIIG